MPLSDYALDTFVVHKLSKLTICGAVEIPTYANYVSTFILNQLTGVRGDSEPQYRAFAFNFLRRTEGALTAYRIGRGAILEYLQTPREILSPYFLALLNFEVCVSQCYQGLELIRRRTGKKFFEEGDNSDGERMWKLYNASKHAEAKIVQGQIPREATTTVWITNEGLECSETLLSFQDLKVTLLAMSRAAEQIA
jgi:hypothetical protein